MATKLADEDGRVTDALVEYYRRRAEAGGLGAIIVEHAYVHPQGRLEPHQLSAAEDACIEGLERVAQAIHEPLADAGAPVPRGRRYRQRLAGQTGTSAQAGAAGWSGASGRAETVGRAGANARAGTVGQTGASELAEAVAQAETVGQAHAAAQVGAVGRAGTIDSAAAARPLAILQISHAGSAALPTDLAKGLVGSSAIVHPGRKRSGNTGIVPHALTHAEITDVVGAFALAARRAADAGFDGVEVHAAHGYLLDQFYSPIANRRTDEYGTGSVTARARIVAETVAAVREAIRPDMIVFVRIGPCDYAPGGAELAEGPEYARLVEAAGADVLDISGGIYNFSTHDCRPPGFFRESAALIRQAVKAPVLTAGGVHSARDAVWLLESGACDLVGVGRALMRQPAWAANAIADQP